MKTFRFGGWVVAATLFGASAAVADTNKAADANGACRQETKRVSVWPRTAPKAPQMARFEERVLTICDGKVVASRVAPIATAQANDSP